MLSRRAQKASSRPSGDQAGAAISSKPDARVRSGPRVDGSSSSKACPSSSGATMVTVLPAQGQGVGEGGGRATSTSGPGSNVRQPAKGPRVTRGAASRARTASSRMAARRRVIGVLPWAEERSLGRRWRAGREGKLEDEDTRVAGMVEGAQGRGPPRDRPGCIGLPCCNGRIMPASRRERGDRLPARDRDAPFGYRSRPLDYPSTPAVDP